MSWYNETKNIEENVSSFFIDKCADLVMLESLIKIMNTARKNKERSFELTLKDNPTQKQILRHEINCKDYEYKINLVYRCIEIIARR